MSNRNLTLAILRLAGPVFAQLTPAPTLTVRGTGVADTDGAATKASIDNRVFGVDLWGNTVDHKSSERHSKWRPE
jgi:hypothetical protein